MQQFPCVCFMFPLFFSATGFLLVVHGTAIEKVITEWKCLLGSAVISLLVEGIRLGWFSVSGSGFKAVECHEF